MYITRTFTLFYIIIAYLCFNFSSWATICINKIIIIMQTFSTLKVVYQSEYTEFQKMCLFLNFTRIYKYILLTITVQKFKSKVELQKCKFRDLNIYFMIILTAVSFLKRRLLKIAKPPVLQTLRTITQNLDMGMI